jgi:elongator complex protein 3
MVNSEAWYKAREYTIEKKTLARKVLDEVRAGGDVFESVRRNPMPDGGYLPKHILVAVYHDLVERGEIKTDTQLLARIRMKPIRTLSGVTTVTVLTKPYPCPGKCIFCPDDVRMPKSYVPDEPGAKRAVEHDFDPFAQVASRLEALKAVGHPTDKIELLILGGTWSAYRRDYQEWFVRRCFEALNGVPSTTLNEAQEINETSVHRNVGLVIETRPDEVTFKELAWLRYLGVTKVQMGAQSFNDEILALNQRGHDTAQTRLAMDMLRAAGFKIVLHWMPNLLGATLELDRQDFPRLWDGFCPDEIKIYPNQLLENTALYENWGRGEYQPYTTAELVNLIATVKPTIPRYCRVNRIIRDIPSNYVVDGNKRTSLRQDIQIEMAQRGAKCQCIRCREIRKRKVQINDLMLNDLIYPAGKAEEHFLSFDTQDDQLAGFLRLSLPGKDSPSTGMEELQGAAIIREVHIYGQSLQMGSEQDGAAQHMGLGTQLIQKAEKIAKSKGYKRLAVISAIGTRWYYLNRGFQRGKYYMSMDI